MSIGSKKWLLFLLKMCSKKTSYTKVGKSNIKKSNAIEVVEVKKERRGRRSGKGGKGRKIGEGWCQIVILKISTFGNFQ